LEEIVEMAKILIFLAKMIRNYDLGTTKLLKIL
jgi:hypothetical protein